MAQAAHMASLHLRGARVKYGIRHEARPLLPLRFVYFTLAIFSFRYYNQSIRNKGAL